MSKIKINLTNGSQVEKPLVTAFKGANADYLILDNETNGQMGYPIICISRLNGANAEKIIDQTEWNSVKDSLKTIISGTLPTFLAVPEELSASDDFYTQLTLPVASFDLLKKAYAAPEAPAPAAPAAPAEEANITSPEIQAPTIDEAPAPVQEATPAPAEPVALTPDAAATPIITPPIIEAPVVEAPAQPAAPTEAPAQIPVAPVVQTPAEAPQPQAAPANDNVQQIKDTFMKSCENMFEALLKQMQG